VKVTEPAEWVNSLVAAEKPRKFRICLDPRDLNKAIKRPHYPLPTLDEITAKLAETRYFSVMDARSGYWAIKLTEESSKLTTFDTILGATDFQVCHLGSSQHRISFTERLTRPMNVSQPLLITF